MKNKVKEPILSILLNSIFLGFGHLYAGAKNRGMIILCAVVGFTTIVFTWARHPTTDLKFLSMLPGQEKFILAIFYALCTIVTILIWIDGYKCTKKYNIENGLEKTITGGKKTLLIIGIIVVNLGLNLSMPLALLIRTYVVQAFKIPSGAMNPTLIKKDRIFTNKFAYKNKGPERGDIAVFVYPEDPSRDFVKRVIAQGGELVEIREGDIYINDVMVTLPVIKNIFYYNRGEYGKAGVKIQVPEGHYFVLGG